MDALRLALLLPVDLVLSLAPEPVSDESFGGILFGVLTVVRVLRLEDEVERLHPARVLLVVILLPQHLLVALRPVFIQLCVRSGLIGSDRSSALVV